MTPPRPGKVTSSPALANATSAELETKQTLGNYADYNQGKLMKKGKEGVKS